MDDSLKKILLWMLHRHIVGHKHFPEKLAISPRLKHLPKYLHQSFYKEYEELIVQGYFIRLKKRTGKGSGWHISINPETIEEIKILIGDDDEDAYRDLL